MVQPNKVKMKKSTYIYIISSIFFLFTNCKKEDNKIKDNINQEIIIEIDTIISVSSTKSKVFINIKSIGGAYKIDSSWCSLTDKNLITYSESVNLIPDPSTDKYYFEIITIPDNKYLVTFGLKNSLGEIMITTYNYSTGLEVINIELLGSFKGFIGNREINFTQNINGYTCLPDIGYNDLPGKLGERKYYSDIKSITSAGSIRMGIGSLKFEKSQGNEPNLNSFTSYMMDNINFTYSKEASDGFEIRYTDELNQNWVSNPSSKSGQSIIFIETSIESDTKNDYCKFTALFDCWVYRNSTINGTATKDSLKIRDAKFKGWFSRIK